jgi:zinc protease
MKKKLFHRSVFLCILISVVVCAAPARGWREAIEEQKNTVIQKEGGTVTSENTVSPTESAEYVLREIYYEKAGVTEQHLSNGGVIVMKPIRDGSGIITLEAVSPGGLAAAGKADRLSAALAPFLCAQTVRLQRSVGTVSERIRGRAEKQHWEALFVELSACFEESVLTGSDFDEAVDRLSAVLFDKEETPVDRLRTTINRSIGFEDFTAGELQKDALQNIKRDIVCRILNERFSGADDFTFIFTGDFSPADIEPYIRRFIAPLPAGNAEEQWPRAEDGMQPSDERRRLTAASGSKAAGALLFYSDYSWSRRTNLILECIRDMLAIRFRQSLPGFDDGGSQADTILRYSRYPRQRYVFGVAFETDPPAAEEFSALLRSEIDRFCKTGPSPQAVRELRAQRNSEWNADLKEIGFWKAELLKAYIHSYEPPEILAFERLLNEMEEIDFKAECRRYIGSASILDLIVMPE